MAGISPNCIASTVERDRAQLRGRKQVRSSIQSAGPPTALALPLKMGTSACPAGSSPMRLHPPRGKLEAQRVVQTVRLDFRWGQTDSNPYSLLLGTMRDRLAEPSGK